MRDELGPPRAYRRDYAADIARIERKQRRLKWRWVPYTMIFGGLAVSLFAQFMQMRGG